MYIDAKDNITVIDKDDNVVAVITDTEIINYDGYKVLFDVGAEED